MRFLVDAQLPRRFAAWLREAGHDALHTLDLPEGNRTADATITELSTRERRIVVTKDADFVVSFVLRHEPQKLLLISTGNITNTELESLLRSNLDTVVRAFDAADFVEMNRGGVIVHG
jgi:predicted nuclease of predicted toxin-antitoxin system